MSNFWLLGEGATAIPQNADMHNYITPGNYSCSTSESISTFKNCPVNATFIMKAYYSNGGGDPNYVYLIQEYITFDGKQRALSIYNNEAGKITWSTVKYPTKDDLTPVKYTGFTAGTGKTITANSSYCVGKLLIACLKVKIEGAGGQVVKIASNILNSGGTTIVGIGTEWSVTKSIYMYIGYDSLVVNEEDFVLGQYLHICVPIVLK